MKKKAHPKVKKVVLAYSGGLDTSVILKWLQDIYGCEVVTFTADIGQGEELEPARKKAKMLGVKQIFIEDLREEFVRDFVFPMFRANAVYEGEYLLGTSIARPLIAKRLVEIARKTGADAISPRRDRQGQRPGALRARRLRADAGRQDHRAVARVGPDRRARSCSPTPRSTASRSISRSARAARPTRWTRTCCTSRYEGGILEDPNFEPEESMWRITVSPEKAPNRAASTSSSTTSSGDIVAHRRQDA